MAVLALDCPHCAVKKSSFAIQATTRHIRNKQSWCVFGTCTACGLPVSVVLFEGTYSGEDPNNTVGDLTRGTRWQVKAVYPPPEPLDIPNKIPENVERAYTQAAENRRLRHFDAAAAMYRKAMELALKDRSPEIDAWKIEKRIDKMADQGLITKELHDWAHELRLDGNNAVHEDEMEEGPVDDMHSFCKFLLTYLYTLPEQVKAARARRDGN